MPHIRHLVKINASPARIYEAVTSQSGLASWWTTEVNVKPGEENKLTLHFGLTYFKELTLESSNENKRAVWKCLAGDPEWVDTKLVFDLRADEAETKLFFEHNDWDGYTDMFSQCSYDWTIFLRSLKDYCETGKGRPFPTHE